MKIKSRKKKSPTIILTPELQSFKDAQGEHGMGCLFEDDIPPVNDKPSPSSSGMYLGERMCPACDAHLDFDAYEGRYKCKACGWVQGDIPFHIAFPS